MITLVPSSAGSFVFDLVSRRHTHVPWLALASDDAAIGQPSKVSGALPGIVAQQHLSQGVRAKPICCTTLPPWSGFNILPLRVLPLVDQQAPASS